MQSEHTFRARPLFVELGTASYAVYLWHVPLLYMWFDLMVIGGSRAWLADLSFPVLIVAICVISLRTTFSVERPVLAFLCGRRDRDSRSSEPKFTTANCVPATGTQLTG